MLPRICRAFKAAYSQNLHTVWSIYTACLGADRIDKLLRSMFKAKPELAVTTYRARGELFAGDPPQDGWGFVFAATKAGCLGSIRGMSRHMTVSALATLLIFSGHNEPCEWVWWAKVLVEKSPTQDDIERYLLISLLSVECFNNDCLRAVCAHMRYMVNKTAVYRLIWTIHDGRHIFFYPDMRNLHVLMQALEVRLGWRDEEFRRALRSTLGCGDFTVFFALAEASGYYEDRSIQFAIRRELRDKGHDPRRVHTSLEKAREEFS